MTETMLSATGAGDPAAGPAPLPEVLSAHGGADLDILGVLDALDALPVSEHVAVYESIHRSLQTALEEPEHG